MSQTRYSKLKAPCFIKVTDLTDLGRFACAFERAPFPIFSFKHKGNFYLAAQSDIFKGRSVLYFYLTKQSNSFLGYKNIGGTEETILSDSTSNSSYIFAPIISIIKIPKIFKDGLEHLKGNIEKFIPIKLKDLESLVKIGAYKMLFEEPPLPLYSFQSNKNNILGAFTRIDEYEEASFFFYIELDNHFRGNFLKYSTSKNELEFCNKIDEHGYVYIKIIKLAEMHPLVEFEE
jgi:hypothetical protein